MMIRFPNKKAEATYTEWNEPNPDKPNRVWTPISENEFSAFLGISLVKGCHNSSQKKLQIYGTERLTHYFEQQCRKIVF